jgi:hypothetical protein
MATFAYPCEATTVSGFLAQLVRYVAAGHYFYITGVIPRRKEPSRVDGKLIALYDIAQPKWRRARRHRAGTAGVHYLRYKRFFVLIATRGEHRFFLDHADQVRDIRRTALKFRGYSIRHTFSQNLGRWKVFVRLDRETYRDLRAYLVQVCVRPECHDGQQMEAEFEGLPVVPYQPVRRQLLAILKVVNRKRRQAGLSKLAPTCIPKALRIGTVFADNGRSAPDVEAA